MNLQQELQENLEYRDGNLYYKKRCNQCKIGDKAGWKNNSDYLNLKFKGKTHRLHRTIWVYHYGDIDQTLEIDHINGDKLDNRVENLRCVSRGVNIYNRKRKDGTKTPGISLTPFGGHLYFRAKIQKDGKSYHKYFKTEEEAIAWRKEKEQELYGFGVDNG